MRLLVFIVLRDSQTGNTFGEHLGNEESCPLFMVKLFCLNKELVGPLGACEADPLVRLCKTPLDQSMDLIM